jgi:hypothetical protein
LTGSSKTVNEWDEAVSQAMKDLAERYDYAALNRFAWGPWADSNVRVTVDAGVNAK